jgi:hypothetical protein
MDALSLFLHGRLTQPCQHVTHAHIMLVGFVVSLIYGVIHRLWLGEYPATLARVQFISHHAGAIAMSTGLLLLYGGVMAEARIEPLLSAAAISVLSAAIMMLVMAVKANRIHMLQQDEALVTRGIPLPEDA